MLVASGNGPVGKIVICGLDAENVRRLREGRPILKELAQFGGPDVTLVIMYGEKLEDIMTDLKAMGAVLPPAQTSPKLND